MITHLIFILGLATLPVITHRPKPNLFDVPPGAAAKVSIINTTLVLSGASAEFFLAPPLEGFDDLLPLLGWSFLVESSTGKKALFDLGMPTDPLSSYTPPALVEDIRGIPGMHVDKDVGQILEENGVNLSEINTIVRSHHHFDHIGDPSTFPTTTELVVGPGFKDEFLPAYPTDPGLLMQERYFANRTLREISFTTPSPSLTRAGSFPAFDLFGDGSFYLLDTLGHSVGHLAGLARTTTSPDTFIFMGGDLVHHSAEMRPSPYRRIPRDVKVPGFPKLKHGYGHRGLCPGEVFERLNLKRGRRVDQSFFDPVLAVDVPIAMETIRGAQRADGDGDVFFVFAHDPWVGEVVDFFPKRANWWRREGWGERARWLVLEELVPAVKIEPGFGLGR